MKTVISVASRTSRLAGIQVDEIASLFPDMEFQTTACVSYGDIHKDISLMSSIPDDFFTLEIDQMVVDRRVDVAIHSAKDLPRALHPDLQIVAITRASDTSDALISRHNLTLSQLTHGARLGTSSLSRKNQILAIRPDLEIVSIRGPIEERIGYINLEQVDAVIVATCALQRLRLLDSIAEILPIETHPMQGHLAITARRDRPDLTLLFRKIDIRTKYGKVWLAGGGPGDQNLLTLKTEKLLAHADVVIYDALVNKSIVESLDTELIFVGKRKGNHTRVQHEINEILFQQVSAGKLVVRLKGGDPAIFGRGGEEYKYLSERHVPVEIVPGITSAIAAAAEWGFPLTQRNLSGSVAFCSGHPIASFIPPETDTLVVYMGISVCSKIARICLERGRSKETPLALLYEISRPRSEAVFMTLDKLSRYQPPEGRTGLIIMGEAVRRFQPQPVILVTGTEIERYISLGRIIHTPLIKIEPLPNHPGFPQPVEEYDLIVFTSKYSVHHFFSLINKTDHDTRILCGIKVVSIGERTTTALRAHGIIPDLTPDEATSSSIIELFKQHNITKKRVLIPRSNSGGDTLVYGLEQTGNKIDNVVCYINRAVPTAPLFNLQQVDCIAFASPSGVDAFMKLYGQMPADKLYYSTGKLTSSAIKKVCINAQISQLS